MQALDTLLLASLHRHRPDRAAALRFEQTGCIGAIGAAEMKEAVAAVAGAMKELGIARGTPSSTITP
jgi:acetylornithine deacetylase/succinyl-diaminopimelate desuccinylase-like protein